MSRRGRWRLLIVLVVLLLPMGVAGTVIWFIRTGRLTTRIESWYSDHLPGRLLIHGLRIASIRRLDVDRVELHFPATDVQPILAADSISAVVVPWPFSLRRLSVAGFALTVDRRLVALLQALGPRLSTSGGSGGGPSLGGPLAIDLTGAIDGAGVLALKDLHVAVTAGPGQALHGDITGMLGSEPLHLAISSTGSGPTFVYHVDLIACRVALAPLFDLLVALDVTDSAYRETQEWIPKLGDISGSRLTIHPSGGTMGGAMTVAWAGGTGACHLFMDRDHLVLTHMKFQDQGLGGGTGGLQVLFKPHKLIVDLDHWHPGPRLPIPSEVPTQALMTALGAAHFELWPVKHKMHLALSLRRELQSPTPHVDLAWIEDGMLDISGGGVPLTDAQAWLPQGVIADGGDISSIALRIDPDHHPSLQTLDARATTARLHYQDWRLGPVAFGLSIRLDADHQGFSGTATLPFGTVNYRNRAHRLGFSGDGLDLAGLAADLSAPVHLPALSGRASIDIDLPDPPPATTRCSIHRLVLDHVAVGSLVKTLSLNGEGALEIAPGRTTLDLHGQISAGRLDALQRHLDLAERTPVFTTTMSFTPQGFSLDRGLVRGGDVHGQPVTAGFNLGIHGSLDQRGNGTFAGVADHADMGWLKRDVGILPLPTDSTISGVGAATVTIAMADGRISRVDGSFLPFNDDLTLPSAHLRVTGITGAIYFHVPITPPPAAAQPGAADAAVPAAAPVVPAPPPPPPAPPGAHP